MPGQESRQGGRVPAAGVDQGGGVVCCAMDQAGGRRDPVQSVRQISNQRGGSVRALVPDVLRIRQGGGRGSGEKKKQAGRAVCGVVLPAVLCAAVIFCPDPASRNAAGGTVSRFFRAVLCAAPEGSDSPLYRVVLYV